MEESIVLFQDLLKFDVVISRQTGTFTDIENLGDKSNIYERVLLTHKQKHKGPFSQLLGQNYIELVSCQNKTGRKIFENRYWGDLGYIHLCFDIIGMEAIKVKCKQMNYPFTIDSQNTFDMGEAAGHFSYIETKEGILIEFVETHKIPIIKKLSWYLNLLKRNREKPLSRWVLKGLKLNRKKTKVN